MTDETEKKDPVRHCYHTHFSRVDYNAGLPDEQIVRYTSHSSSTDFSKYTELDERLDKQDEKPKEKPEEKPDDVYAPIHDYRWATLKAFDGEHCVCETIPGWRLVYALDKWTLRKYSKNGITIETIEPTFEVMNTKTWRLWNGD